jgi:hypothetical protein
VGEAIKDPRIKEGTPVGPFVDESPFSQLDSPLYGGTVNAEVWQQGLDLSRLFRFLSFGISLLWHYLPLGWQTASKTLICLFSNLFGGTAAALSSLLQKKTKANGHLQVEVCMLICWEQKDVDELGIEPRTFRIQSMLSERSTN